MKKQLYNEIEIPEGVEAEIDGTILKIKGPEGEIERKFKTPRLVFEKKDNKIIIGSDKATKTEKRNMNTITSHIKNIIKGVQEKFEYKVKVCSSHFPMTVDINGREIKIKNFLGEKIPRKTVIQESVDIEKDGDFIIIKSVNKERAGQAAAKLERATQLSKKDRRIFQDGIYIVNKAGRDI